MRDKNSLDRRKRSDGAVLLLAMVFMLLTAVVAGTVMEVSVQQFQMAGNDQFREEAFQRAQSISEEIVSDRDNFPITGSVGYKICDDADPDPKCNSVNFIGDLQSSVTPDGVEVSYQVIRQGPEIMEGLPFRQSESQVSSAPAFDAALFEVVTDVDGTASRLGRASVVIGVSRVVASSAQ